jgi:cysteine desulfurase
MADLREYAIEKLAGLDVVLNIPMGKCAPHVLNVTLPRIKSETMLHFLSAKGIYVSSGSACSSHSSHPSSSLIAFGVSAADADCSIRISFGAFNEREDVDALSEALAEGIEKLVKIRK